MDELRISVQQQPQSANVGGSEKKEPGLDIQSLAAASSSECTITEIRESPDPLLVRPILSVFYYMPSDGPRMY